jgi:lysophospholipase L1-like esterase
MHADAMRTASRARLPEDPRFPPSGLEPAVLAPPLRGPPHLSHEAHTRRGPDGPGHWLTGLLLALVSCLGAAETQKPAVPEERFAGEIAAFRTWDSKNALPANAVLFVGSSTIRMWRTAESFPDLPVVNRGFGGAQFPDLLRYRDEVLLHYPAPACIVLYCGDNDVASARKADQVSADFAELHRAIRAAFPKTVLVYLTIKPCPSRWQIWPEQKRANELIAAQCAQDPLARVADIATPLLATGSPPAETLFLEDKLHFSDAGYRLCTEVLRPILTEVRATP